MTFDFAFYLTLAVLITGVLTLLDVLVLARKRLASGAKQSMLVEYARAFFPILLIVWVLRSFLIQPYRVPTGSLEPTIMPGDFIAVNQFDYGLRLPVINKKVISISEPKRGDIALFRWPVNPKVVFVKRVIGLPGDHIVYKNKVLYINGVEAKQKFIKKTVDYGNAPGQTRVVYKMQENLNGVKHDIFIQPVGGETRNYDLIVPPHEYFMMGDNRDDSDDSRSWGFVPEKNLIGKAFGIWMSWDPVHHRIRWNRIGMGV